MRRYRLFILGVVALALGVLSLASPAEATVAGCDRECATITTCQLSEDRICTLSPWFPCVTSQCDPD